MVIAVHVARKAWLNFLRQASNKMSPSGKLTATLLAVILSGCAGPRGMTREQAELEYRPQLHEISLADGIDKSEAEVIARAYFSEFCPMNGGLSGVYDGGQEWVAKTAIGDTFIKHLFSTDAPLEETKEPIRINKKTGRVTWSDGPTIDDPRTIDDHNP
jgi:hypothetical protein